MPQELEKEELLVKGINIMIVLLILITKAQDLKR